MTSEAQRFLILFLAAMSAIRAYHDALLRLHPGPDRLADRRAQRRMHARLQHALADLDLELEVVAEEHLRMDGAAQHIDPLGLLLRELQVLEADREHDAVADAQLV